MVPPTLNPSIEAYGFHFMTGYQSQQCYVFNISVHMKTAFNLRLVLHFVEVVLKCSDHCSTQQNMLLPLKLSLECLGVLSVVVLLYISAVHVGDRLTPPDWVDYDWLN